MKKQENNEQKIKRINLQGYLRFLHSSIINFSGTLRKNILSVLGLILSIVSLLYAYQINNKSNIISKDIKTILDNVDYNTNAMVEVLKYQAIEILKSDKLFEELTIDEKAVIANYYKYNKNPQTAEEWFLKGYTIGGNVKGIDDNVDYDTVIKCYQEAIKCKPDFARAYYNLGYAYVNKQIPDYDKAIECYQEAIKYKPDYARAYNNMGRAYRLGKGDYDKAIKCHLEAIKIKPDYAYAYNNLGIAYQVGKQNYNEAIKCYQEAIKYIPDLPDAYNNIGFAYKNGKQDYDTAITYYEMAIKYGPYLLQPYFNIGIAYAERGKNSNKAIEYFHKTIEIYSNFVEKYGSIQKENTYALCENIEKVVEYCQKEASLGNEKAQQWLQWKESTLRTQ